MHLAPIVLISHSFGIARGAQGHVSNEKVPITFQQTTQPLQGVQAIAHFLNGDRIKAAQNLGDVVIGIIAAVAIFSRVKLANIPGGQQQGVCHRSCGNGLGQRRSQTLQAFDGALAHSGVFDSLQPSVVRHAFPLIHSMSKQPSCYSAAPASATTSCSLD